MKRTCNIRLRESKIHGIRFRKYSSRPRKGDQMCEDRKIEEMAGRRDGTNPMIDPKFDAFL